ncbi:LL-diaminopimelate aminotransferase [Salsuginibacillus kocurii]|uniref:LL-diaminopimelate aminotransferase n=1 Tax=Salsuginibacillus kocurii TaxID=427078 RepID=UPI00035DDE97|nr:LL-diaminopimelate aminotransferase [Salsuginibacillus kocurii]
MIQPSNRLHTLSSSVFSDMALKKREKMEAGHEMIDLSIGSPDLPPPKWVREKMAEQVLHPDAYRYTLSGTREFHQAVSHFYHSRYHTDIKEEEVLQLMGSQDGLAHVALAYLDPGDYIIVPDPGYPIYGALAELSGASLYTVPVTEEQDFMPDLYTIPREVLSRAKLLILNYPGNPTAALASKAYLEEAVQFALKHNLLLLHDFAYSELVFDGHEPLSIFSVPDAKKTAIEFNSLSKSFNLAGARIGYCVGFPSFLKPLASIKSHIDYGVFQPIQHAATHALLHGGDFLESHCKTYENRRNTFVQTLHKFGWNVRYPDGAMFVWAKVPERYDSMSFALAALDEGVVVTPGEAFGKEGEAYVRIALVQEEEQLIKAATRLKALI